jgi:hypothetical protein
VIATASARNPSDPDPSTILPILVGLDSYSDVTVAALEFVYNKRKISESVGTGARTSEYYEEEFIDIADGLYSFHTLPALVASSPHHLPTSCSLLLGVPQLNELDIRVDVHRKQRRLPLSSYDPAIILAADPPLECHLSEKDLLKWADHNATKSVGSVPYSYLDVDVNPALPEDQQQQIRQVTTSGSKPFLTPPCRPPSRDPQFQAYLEARLRSSAPVGSGCHGCPNALGRRDVMERPLRTLSIRLHLTPAHCPENPFPRP